MLKTLTFKLGFFASLSIGILIWQNTAYIQTRIGFHMGLANHFIHYIASRPQHLFSKVYTYLEDREKLIGRIDWLEEEYARMSSQLPWMTLLEKENKYLRKLLFFTNDIKKQKFIVVEPISVRIGVLKHKLIIDTGAESGVHTGQPVLGIGGILGQVTTVSSFGATVSLITEAGQVVLGQVGDANIKVLVEGTGSFDRLNLLYIPTSADVKVGDMVTTSGLDKKFPADYPVAEVYELERSAGASFLRAFATPVESLTHNSKVILVWPPSNTLPPQAQEAALK